MVLQIDFLSKLNLLEVISSQQEMYFFTRSSPRHIPVQKELGLKYKGNQKSVCSEFQVFSRKLFYHFSGCFHLPDIFLCSKITHTSPEECRALTLGWLSGLQHSGHWQPSFICLAAWAGIPITGSSSSKKCNCFSLLSSEFGVTSSSSFSRVLLYLKGRVL